MLSDSDYLIWCQSIGHKPETRAVIDLIRNSPPARRVSSRAGNVSGSYPSRKMGLTIQFESHKNELAAILEFEYDPDVLEYYDQPVSPIKLAYKTRNGKSICAIHTPDFFVIRKDSSGWVECKTETELIELAESNPNRYKQNNGAWYCPPGESYARELGLTYEIRSSKANKVTFLRNMEFLEDYFRSEKSLVAPSIRNIIVSAVKERPGISLDRLLGELAGVAPDHVYSLIATRDLWVDLDNSALREPEKVFVYAEEQKSAQPDYQKHSTDPAVGQSINWDGVVWTIVNRGETSITLVGDDKTFTTIPILVYSELAKAGLIKPGILADDSCKAADLDLFIEQASPESLAEANKRFAIISSYLKGEQIHTHQQSERAIFYWLSRYRRAEMLYGNGYIGLIPKEQEKGNRRPKISRQTKALMVKFIDEQYETLKQRPIYEVYGALIRECELSGLTPPSYVTFSSAVKNRPLHQQIIKRRGKRAAYRVEPFYYELELTTPKHGDRPFHICHLDHTELDIELVCSTTGQALGRPWLSLMTDAFSRRILALFLTYDSPSYRSCMMSLRECVRRLGRFPQILVVDGGKEFHSTYFDTLLARYECIKKTRPTAKARFGSVVERLFGTTNTQFIYNLAGNTQITKTVRQVTKSVNPKLHAVWTLDALYKRLCQWAYEIYDALQHPALGQSPEQAFVAGIRESGERSHRFIPYDNDFQMLTLPTTAKGSARIYPGKGIKINNLYYWSNSFRDPEAELTQVPVKYDPYDAGIAYAYVRNRWVRCTSEYFSSFQGRSEREMMLLTSELRKRQQNHSRQFTVTAKKLADFLSAVESEEAVLFQRLRDKEAKQVFQLIEAGIEPGNTASKPLSHDFAPQNHRQEGEQESGCINPNKLIVYEEF